eukprot:CAMPEP_0201506686 /NCGR_PEP_ID=MMETSP0161_2-20130828/568_1 /ASSEMBLY_ACC=CAM_ASM_000251 /TAXON_ID=180227 /ORGANISM="Neoparamoeba aestuarina, Strain SoJaBio B1-5/56/2" /LENGTH=155 /DNA_ID=CAMNT_0047900857 /DNA_START=84 /DNA_END=551 /DNA_ORIENTATION=-
MAAIDCETNAGAIKAAWEGLNNAGDFVVLELNGNTLQVRAQGSDGLAGVKGSLDNNQVLWGAFNVTGVDELSGVTTRSQNRVTFTFLGEGLNAIRKSQVSNQRGAVLQTAFPGQAATFDIDEAEDLDPAFITKKLCGKAHRPQYFDFGNGLKVDV